MRKPSLSFLILVAMIASVAQADTIHLKNGSLLKGKVTSFADDQFVVMLDTGSGRYCRKAMVKFGARRAGSRKFDVRVPDLSGLRPGAMSRGIAAPTLLEPAEKDALKETKRQTQLQRRAASHKPPARLSARIIHPSRRAGYLHQKQQP